MEVQHESRCFSLMVPLGPTRLGSPVLRDAPPVCPLQKLSVSPTSSRILVTFRLLLTFKDPIPSIFLRGDEG